MQDASNLPGNDGGSFSDGNPATNVAGTKLLSQFMNDLMKNIVKVITNAGISLTDDREEDLYDAIKATNPTDFLLQHNAGGTHKVDDLTIEDAGNTLNVVNNGINTAQLANNAVDETKLDETKEYVMALLRIAGIASPPLALAIFVTGDTIERFSVSRTGIVQWGPGGAGATDVSLERLSAGTLGITGALDITAVLRLIGAASPATALAIAVTGDTIQRLAINRDGKCDWGPGGAVATDVSLERLSAGVLRLTGDLEVTGVLLGTDVIDTTQIAAGAVENSQLGTDAVNGSKIADTSVDTEHLVNDAVDATKLDEAGSYTVAGLACSNTAASITHTATEHKKTYGPGSVIPDTTDPIDNSAINGSIRAQAASDFDVGYINVDLPIGAVITELNLYGETLSGVGNTINVALSTTNSVGFFDLVYQNTLDDGEVNDEESGLSFTIVEDKDYYFVVSIKVASDTSRANFFFMEIVYTTTNLQQTL